MRRRVRVLRHRGHLPRLPHQLPQAGRPTRRRHPALRAEIRDLGFIPDHIKKVVGGEALAWHTADWWRFQWEITDLVEVTAARLQESGWDDWLTWSRAVSAYRGEREGTLDMVESDQGEYLTFAILAARKS